MIAIVTSRISSPCNSVARTAPKDERAIKANLMRAGATILRIDPITSVTAGRPDPPTNLAGQRLGDHLFGCKH
jgi:hypothetical protein